MLWNPFSSIKGFAGMTCFLRADILFWKSIYTAVFMVGTLAIGCLIPRSTFAADQISASLKIVATSDGSSKSNAAVAEAARRLQSLPSSSVTKVLSHFTGATVRGKNWLRSLAADVADNGEYPADLLRNFYSDHSNDADGRYVAFQLLVARSPELKGDFLVTAETDPSLPLRYLKIQSLLSAARDAMEVEPGKAQKVLRSVVSNARSPKQLETAVKLLEELDVEIDLAKELGMMRRWRVVGPFDNTGSAKFNTNYTPEQRYLESGMPYVIDGTGDAKPELGKSGPVNWVAVESDDSLGMVDLNEPLGGAKDAAGYAFTKFILSESVKGKTQIRIGCVTANKVWVNGQLVSANEVYHSGTRIDQYIDDCVLVEGENTVLIKVMQNAQTEPWAQDWQFQFRLTRDDGSAIQAAILD